MGNVSQYFDGLHSRDVLPGEIDEDPPQSDRHLLSLEGCWVEPDEHDLGEPVG